MEEDDSRSSRSRSPAMGMAALQQRQPAAAVAAPEDGGRRSSGGILRVDSGKSRRRSSDASVDLRADVNRVLEGDPSSPCPSDRLSVKWADGDRSMSADSRGSAVVEHDNPSIVTLLPTSTQPSPKHALENMPLDPAMLLPESARGGDGGKSKDRVDDNDDDLCASISVIMERSNSRRHKRRGSSFRRRLTTKSSVHSESCSDTVVEVETEANVARQQLHVYREVLAGVREVPWPITRKLKLARSARAYLAENEGAEEERLAQSTSTRDIIYRHFRYISKTLRGGLHFFWNWLSSLELWYGRFKRIESHFGSAVASYFYFLRWVMGLNVALVVVTSAFVIIPEFLAASRHNTGERKFMLDEERVSGYDFKVIWNFEGMLRYSPFFYGYYSRAKTTSAGYRIPEAYFLTFVMIFAFSFIMIIRKMTENQRMSKLSYDKAEFTCSLLGGWDYAIGNREAAQNKVAAINMGFKELLQGAQEKDRTLTGWRLLACRCFAHLTVLCLLVSSAYAVVLLVKRSMEVDETFSWWRQNELSVVLTLISQVFPNLFKVVSQLEYLLPRQEVQMQLARIMALNLLNLTTFTFTLYMNIRVMYADSDKIRRQLIATHVTTQMGNPTSSFSPANISLDFNTSDLFTSLEPNYLTENYTDWWPVTTTVAMTTSAAAGLVLHGMKVNSSDSPTLAGAVPLNVTTSIFRMCKKVSIPCSTSTPLYVDDYVLFPNDTINVITTGHGTLEAAAATSIDKNFTFRPRTIEGDVATSRPGSTVGNVSTSTEQNYISSSTSYIGNLTVNDDWQPGVSDLNYYSTTLNGASIEIVMNETSILLNESDTLLTNEMMHTRNKENDSITYSEALPFPIENVTLSLNISDKLDSNDAMLVFNEDVHKNLNRKKRFLTFINDEDVINDWAGQDYDERLDRVKRQNDYEHHFSANVYDTRLINTIHDRSTVTIKPTYKYLLTEGEINAKKIPLNSLSPSILSTNAQIYHQNVTHSNLPSNEEFNSITTDDNANNFYNVTNTETTSSSPEESENSFHITITDLPSSSEEINHNFTEIPSECYAVVCEDDPLEGITEHTPETSRVTIGIPLQPTHQIFTNFTDSLYEDMDMFVVDNVTNHTTASPVLTTASDLDELFVWKAPETRDGESTLADLEFMVQQLPPEERKKLRRLCWETAIGQEIVKIIVMDLVVTIAIILITEYIRALVVRFMNTKNCCWDLEKKFPGYAGFDIAENIFHLINNQGLVWMGMFFSPCLPVLNLVKLVVLLYVRSWAVVTSNVPPETVYKASDNNNFYLLLFLAMLFLCMLPVWFTMIWVPPSWHCGPFSDYKKIYNLFPFIDFISIPFFVIPTVLLLMLGMFYYVSVTRALREANQDLYEQLCHKRNEERQKAQAATSRGVRTDDPSSRWARLLSVTPVPGVSSFASLTARLKEATAGKESLRSPRLTSPDALVSLPADDMTETDPGQSEVFDDSISEARKATYKPITSRDENSAVDVKVALYNKPRGNSVPTDYTGKLEKRVRNRIGSQDSAGSSLPKTPRPIQKNKQFSFPETKDEETQKDRPLRKSDYSKREAKQSAAPPESSHKDYIRRDVPSTPLIKHKHGKAHDRRESGESRRRQSLGKTSIESKDSPAVDRKERHEKVESRPSLEKVSKYSDSPSKKRKSLRQRRTQVTPTVIVDIHGPDKELDSKKANYTTCPEIEEKDNEMQTIPVIKISKEDSVERSIEQAKLDRQKAVVESDSVENFQMADDSDAPTVHDRPVEDANESCTIDAVQLAHNISKVTDSPDLTYSVSTSTPSSNSRKTYVVASHVESDVDDISEAYTLTDTPTEKSMPSIGQKTGPIAKVGMASQPRRTSEDHKQSSAPCSSAKRDLDDVDADKIIGEIKLKEDIETNANRDKTGRGQNKENRTSSRLTEVNIAPRAEFEKDYLSNDDAE